MRLSIFLHGTRFEYVACRTAALLLLREQQLRRYADDVIVDLADTAGLRRLPNERLFLDP